MERVESEGRTFESRTVDEGDEIVVSALSMFGPLMWTRCICRFHVVVEKGSTTSDR